MSRRRLDQAYANGYGLSDLIQAGNVAICVAPQVYHVLKSSAHTAGLWGVVNGLWSQQWKAKLAAMALGIDLDFTELWAHLSCASLQEKRDGSKLLALPENARTLLRIAGLRTVFVREWYDRLADMVLKVVPSGEPPQNMITGTPGIGKSIFGVYLLYLCALRQQSVVYHTDSAATLFFSFDSSGNPIARVIRECEFERFKRDRSVLYVADTDSPEMGFSGVWISSPRPLMQAHKWLGQSTDSCTRYVPLWTDEELTRLLQHCYPDAEQHMPPIDRMQEYIQAGATRAEVFGAVPRYLLAKHLAAPVQMLLGAIQNANLEQLGRDIAKQLQCRSESCHMILHMFPIDDSFTVSHFRFASEPVKRAAVDVIIAGDHEAAKQWIRQLSRVPEAAAVRGALLEALNTRASQAARQVEKPISRE